jgi:hypothetical protein
MARAKGDIQVATSEFTISALPVGENQTDVLMPNPVASHGMEWTSLEASDISDFDAAVQDVIDTNPPPSVGDNSITFAKIQDIPTDSLIGRDTAGTGDPQTILLNSTLSMDGTGNLQRAALTGDITASAGSNTTTIANDAVTNVKAANMADATIKGRVIGAGTGDPTDLSASQVKSILALTSADLTDFNEASQDAVGTILSNTSTVQLAYSDAAPQIFATIPADAVTNTELANMVQATIKGRDAGAGTGDPQDLTVAQVQAMLGIGVSPTSPPSVANQTILAATLTQFIGSLITVTPSFWQIGTVFRWTVCMTKTAAGTAARTFLSKQEL